MSTLTLIQVRGALRRAISQHESTLTLEEREQWAAELKKLLEVQESLTERLAERLRKEAA